MRDFIVFVQVLTTDGRLEVQALFVQGQGRGDARASARPDASAPIAKWQVVGIQPY